MMRIRRIFAPVICAAGVIISLASGPAWLAEAAPLPWYSDHERGWFWYEVEPEPEPEEQAPETAMPPAPEVPARAEQPADPPVLSAAWIRKYLEKFQERAIDNPTPENVAAFLYVQRAMMDKSQRFAEQVVNVVRQDPYLDQNTRRPIATFGNNLFAREAQAARQAILQKIARQAGIFFFFQSTCKQCEIQAPVLKGLQDRYGFVVFPVSVDGLPLANGLYPDYAADRGQARALGVVKTPAMFLGKPSGREIVPLGQNTLAAPQLEENILAAARDAGWITPEEYNRTQGMDASLALNLTPDAMPVGLSEEAVVEYIKKLYREQGEKP